MKKRLVSMVVALSMALSLFPVFSLTVFADAPWGGSGTEADPYLLGTADDIVAFSNQYTSYKGRCFKMTANIDLSGSGFTTIGGTSNCWYGTFDGDGYTISGLSTRFFYQLNDSAGATVTTIKNLNVEGAYASSTNHENSRFVYQAYANGAQSLVFQDCNFYDMSCCGNVLTGKQVQSSLQVAKFIRCGVYNTANRQTYLAYWLGSGYSMIFSECYIYSEINTQSFLVYQNTGTSVTFTDCYAAGAVSSLMDRSANYSGQKIKATVNFTRCYAYNPTKSIPLLRMNTNTTLNTVNYNNAYYLKSSELTHAGPTALTEEQFADDTAYETNFKNFNFQTTWSKSKYGRPILKNASEKANVKLLENSPVIETEYGEEEGGSVTMSVDAVTISTGDSSAPMFTYSIADEDNELLYTEILYDEATGEETGTRDVYLATVEGDIIKFNSNATVGEHTVKVHGTYTPMAPLDEKGHDVDITITLKVYRHIVQPYASMTSFPFSYSMQLWQLPILPDGSGWQWLDEDTIPLDVTGYPVIFPVDNPDAVDYYIYEDPISENAGYKEEYGGIIDYIALEPTDSDEYPHTVTFTVRNADAYTGEETDTASLLEGAELSSSFDYEFPESNVSGADGVVKGKMTYGTHVVTAKLEGFQDKTTDPFRVDKNDANAVTVLMVPDRADVKLPEPKTENGALIAGAKVTVTRPTSATVNPVKAYAWNGGNASAQYPGGSTQQLAVGKYIINSTTYGYAGKTIYLQVFSDLTYKYYSDDAYTNEITDVSTALQTKKLGTPVYNVDVQRQILAGTVTVSVSLQNVKTTSGTFGLRYDPDLFSFNPADDFAINNSGNVYLDKTPESAYRNDIGDNAAEWTNSLGYYVFTWRAGSDPAKLAEINTENGEVLIATYTFHLQDGKDVLNDITNDSISVMPWDETKAARAYKTWYDTNYAGNPEAAGLYKFEEFWRDTDAANSSTALQTGRIESSKAVVNGIDTGGFYQIAVNDDLSSENLASFYDVMTVLTYGFKIKNTALRFTVTDRMDGEPLDGAKVRLYDESDGRPIQYGTTDELGHVTFMVNTSAGNDVTYTYSVERDGYWPIPETLAAEDRDEVTVSPNVAKNVDVPMDLRIYHVPEVLGDTLTLTGKGDLAGERFAYNGHDFHFRVKAAPGYKIETYPTKATVTIGEEGEEGYYQGEITPNDDKLFIIEGEHLNQPAILGDDNLQRVFGEGWDQFRQPNEDGYRSYNIKIEFDQFEATRIDLNVTAIAGTNGKVAYDGTGSDFADVTETITADHEYKIGGIAPDDESKNTVGKFTFTGDTYTAEVDGETKELQYQVDKVFINGVQVHDYDNETQFEYIVGDVKQDTDIAVTFWDGVTHSSDSVMTLVVGDYGEADVTAPVVDEDIRLTRRTYLNPEHLTFAAVPDIGYELYSIRTQLDDELPVEYDLSGVDKAVSNDFTFDPVAGRSKKVYVTFKNPLAEITPTVFVKSYVESGSGTITPFGLLVYNIYDTVTLDLAADTENKWDVSGVKVSPYGKNDEGTVRSFPEIKTTNQYVIDSIQTDTEVGAIFEEHKYTVTGKVDLSQGKDLWSGGGDGYGDVMSGATVTFYRTGDVNGEALDDEMAIPTVTTANRTEAVFTAAIPAGTWKVVVSKQGYVNYIITGYLLNPATDPAEGDAIQFAENNKVITPVIGSTTDGKAVSLIDAAGVRSGMRDNITNAAKAKADVDNNGTPDTLDMAFVLANFGARTTYVKYDDEFLN